MKCKVQLSLITRVVYLYLITIVYACSPGPRYGYRHPLKRLSPLLRGQYIPAMSEKTIGASGPSEGLINKDSSAFTSLVHNYNPNIIFTDEERDGSDRVMTQRCKDRLDTLAVLVTNTWSGVKLRVIEAWDSELRHEDDSLHYEGRAVDFTTSDREQSKYGTLARLAVEAGFDWVYYTYEFHVHASVRADNSDSAKYGGCFPSGSSVISESNGIMSMSDVSVGDRILAADRGTGQLVYSDIIMLMDNQVDVLGRFIEISTKRIKVFLTPNHMLFAMDSYCANKTIPQAKSWNVHSTTWSRCAHATYAEDIKEGQYIFAEDERALPIATKVISTRMTTRRGLVAPLTRHGTIVVDGVIASCYSVFKHEHIAHAAFLPARTFTFFMNIYDDGTGMHWYTQILSSIAHFLFPESSFRLL